MSTTEMNKLPEPRIFTRSELSRARWIGFGGGLFGGLCYGYVLGHLVGRAFG